VFSFRDLSDPAFVNGKDVIDPGNPFQLPRGKS
jgi:hypothetical protein